jgi:hypothetical protein
MSVRGWAVPRDGSPPPAPRRRMGSIWGWEMDDGGMGASSGLAAGRRPRDGRSEARGDGCTAGARAGGVPLRGELLQRVKLQRVKHGFQSRVGTVDGSAQVEAASRRAGVVGAAQALGGGIADPSKLAPCDTQHFQERPNKHNRFCAAYRSAASHAVSQPQPQPQPTSSGVGASATHHSQSLGVQENGVCRKATDEHGIVTEKPSLLLGVEIVDASRQDYTVSRRGGVGTGAPRPWSHQTAAGAPGWRPAQGFHPPTRQLSQRAEHTSRRPALSRTVKGRAPHGVAAAALALVCSPPSFELPLAENLLQTYCLSCVEHIAAMPVNLY